MREFVVHLTHRPGELARVTNALSPVGCEPQVGRGDGRR